ncbi:hypothetical protein EUGRSUZ_C01778, partial [Eucalyptus grandis]
MPMEDHKLFYLHIFLQRDQNYHLEDYIQRVKSWEDDACNCYDKQISLDSDQFTEMILLDGIFGIQLLLMYWDRQRRLPKDQIFGKPWMLPDICRDMALLENQIPFFVVQRLFEMAFGTHQQHMPELLELVCQSFEPVMRKDKLSEPVMESEVKHFVHAISLSFLPSVRKLPNESHKEMKSTPSATELVAAGSECLFDIKFENEVLNIPTFEQCYHLHDSYLIEYMVFMDYLVGTPGDAKLLIDKKTIENCLGNKEATVQLINSLGKGANLSKKYYYFNSLNHKLIAHYEKPYNKWKATFRRDYYSSPWV